MPKGDLVYLSHMLDVARNVVRRVEHRTRAEYEADEDLRIIVAHLVQTVGEAAARVSPSFREAHPEIPWRQIVGIRNRIIHDYMDVDYDILWEVATRDLPSLVAVLNGIVSSEI